MLRSLLKAQRKKKAVRNLDQLQKRKYTGLTPDPALLQYCRSVRAFSMSALDELSDKIASTVPDATAFGPLLSSSQGKLPPKLRVAQLGVCLCFCCAPSRALLAAGSLSRRQRRHRLRRRPCTHPTRLRRSRPKRWRRPHPRRGWALHPRGRPLTAPLSRWWSSSAGRPRWRRPRGWGVGRAGGSEPSR